MKHADYKHRKLLKALRAAELKPSTATGSGDMLKSIYDSDEDGVLSAAQLDLSDKSDIAHTHPGGSEAFPVGSVFLAVVSTNPNTLLGYGTWSAIAQGRMLIGLDSGDADFDTVEEVGGAKVTTIAQGNLPNISTGAGSSHNHIQDAHTHNFLPRSGTSGSVSSIVTGTLDTS